MLLNPRNSWLALGDAIVSNELAISDEYMSRTKEAVITNYAEEEEMSEQAPPPPLCSCSLRVVCGRQANTFLSSWVVSKL